MSDTVLSAPTHPPGAVPDNRWDLLPPPSRPPRVSVVIPYYEQPRHLERLLAGLRLQRGPVEITEILIGDDGSAEAPEPSGWPGGPPILVASQPDLGVRPGAARNLAAADATGDVLAFLDADMVPMPDYLAELSRLPASSEELIVVGTRHHYDLGHLDGAATERWLTGVDAPPPRLEDPAWLAEGYRRTRDLLDLDDRSYQYVIGAVFAMSARLFRDLGGFDETIDVYGGEDWELARRAVRAGALLAHVDAVAAHDGPDWRARVGADGTKNSERCALVELTPELGDGLITEVPVAIVELHDPDGDEDRLLAATAEILRSEPSGVEVRVPREATRLLALARHDPRIGPVPEVEGELSLRTAARLRLRADHEVGRETVRSMVRAVATGGPGRLVIGTPDSPIGEAVGRRHLARVGRWAPHGVDPDWLFGAPTRCEPSDVGLTERARPVDLADVFRR